MSKNDQNFYNENQSCMSQNQPEQISQYFGRQQIPHANDHIYKVQVNIDKIESRIDQIGSNIKNTKISVDRINEAGNSQVEKIQ